ncbi:RING/U-box superfamily protein [Hibiscus syriacus]|uniref:RING/U-box superfamily protein n=1 Tax=Hibiscus syriacus TaxID=106335 RepID=A0A6A3A1K6_HIBSY|nr:RING/U-box superfamily protein [Hibiscus syriacus]
MLFTLQFSSPPAINPLPSKPFSHAPHHHQITLNLLPSPHLPKSPPCSTIDHFTLSHHGKEDNDLDGVVEVDRTLPLGLRREAMPRHVTIIMDGNRRWARSRDLPVRSGYEAGGRSLRTIVELCCKWGIKVLSVFAFSSDNWFRPKGEVELLMSLFESGMQEDTGIFLRLAYRLASRLYELFQIVVQLNSHQLERMLTGSMQPSPEMVANESGVMVAMSFLRNMLLRTVPLPHGYCLRLTHPHFHIRIYPVHKADKHAVRTYLEHKVAELAVRTYPKHKDEMPAIRTYPEHKADERAFGLGRIWLDTSQVGHTGRVNPLSSSPPSGGNSPQARACAGLLKENDIYSFNRHNTLMHNSRDRSGGRRHSLETGSPKGDCCSYCIKTRADGLSDWGGEHRSTSTDLVKEGIVYRLTCLHTFEQNSVVERKRRHVVELALVLLAQTSIPIRFWSYIFLMVVHLSASDEGSAMIFAFRKESNYSLLQQPCPTLTSQPLEVVVDVNWLRITSVHGMLSTQTEANSSSAPIIPTDDMRPSNRFDRLAESPTRAEEATSCAQPSDVDHEYAGQSDEPTDVAHEYAGQTAAPLGIMATNTKPGDYVNSQIKNSMGSQQTIPSGPCE